MLSRLNSRPAPSTAEPTSILLGLSLPLPARFYQQMMLIRLVEERLLELFSQGLLFGTTHTSIGQEANAVGVLNAMDRAAPDSYDTFRGKYAGVTGDVRRLSERFTDFMTQRTGTTWAKVRD